VGRSPAGRPARSQRGRCCGNLRQLPGRSSGRKCASARCRRAQHPHRPRRIHRLTIAPALAPTAPAPARTCRARRLFRLAQAPSRAQGPQRGAASSGRAPASTHCCRAARRARAPGAPPARSARPPGRCWPPRSSARSAPARWPGRRLPGARDPGGRGRRCRGARAAGPASAACMACGERVGHDPCTERLTARPQDRRCMRGWAQVPVPQSAASRQVSARDACICRARAPSARSKGPCMRACSQTLQAAGIMFGRQHDGHADYICARPLGAHDLCPALG